MIRSPHVKRGCAALVVVVLASLPSATFARPAYWVRFEAKYVDRKSPDPDDRAWVKVVTKTRCFVCHRENSTDKSQRNAYGHAVGRAIARKNTRDPKLVEAALDEAAARKADPNDPKSKTFGELIDEHQLPGQGR